MGPRLTELSSIRGGGRLTTMSTTERRTRSPMSNSHKAALALGREQGRAVRGYLEALEAHKPKRGRKRTPESIERRLRDIETKLPAADPLSRLQLLQERMNLEQELAVKAAGVDIAALEDGFVEAAREYGERKGNSYLAWRQAGVEASVLKRAGISRSGA